MDSPVSLLCTDYRDGRQGEGYVCSDLELSDTIKCEIKNEEIQVQTLLLSSFPCKWLSVPAQRMPF